MSLIPFPYNWIALALAACLIFAGGVATGVDWESAHQDRAELTRATKLIERTQTIIKKDNAGLADLGMKNAQLQRENEALIAEAAAHAKNIPDPASCHLAPDRMRTIRAAWGVVDPRPANPERPGPKPEGRSAADLGQPQRPGGVGGAMGPQVSTAVGATPGTREGRQSKGG